MDSFLHDIHRLHSVGLPTREDTTISRFLVPALKILGTRSALSSSGHPILFFMRIYGLQHQADTWLNQPKYP